MNNDEAKDRMAAEIVRLRTELKNSLSQQTEVLSRNGRRGSTIRPPAPGNSLPVPDPDEDYPAIANFEGLKRHAEKYGAEGKTVTIDLLHYIRLVENERKLQDSKRLIQEEIQPLMDVTLQQS